MPRFILIDQHTGYIFGDVADLPSLPGFGSPETAVDAARMLDAAIGQPGRTYQEHPPRSNVIRTMTGGYFVYRADVNGSDAVPVIHDGQDRETIEAVERDCDLVAFVTWSTLEEAVAQQVPA